MSFRIHLPVREKLHWVGTGKCIQIQPIRISFEASHQHNVLLDVKTQTANGKWLIENFQQTMMINCEKISNFFLCLFYHVMLCHAMLCYAMPCYAMVVKFDCFRCESFLVCKSSTKSTDHKYVTFKCFLNRNASILMRASEFWIGAGRMMDLKLQIICSNESIGHFWSRFWQ
jgi:hypothetical protein